MRAAGRQRGQRPGAAGALLGAGKQHRETAPVCVCVCNSSRHDPEMEWRVFTLLPAPAREPSRPQCCWAGLREGDGCPSHPAREGRKQKGFSWWPLGFFLLVWFLLIPFSSLLSLMMEWSQHPGAWLPAGAVGRRSPAAVEKSDDSSKRKN